MKILAASCAILALAILSSPVHAQATASASASVSAAPQAQFVQQPMFAPQFQSFAASACPQVVAQPAFTSFAVAQPFVIAQPVFVPRFANVNIGVGGFGGFGGNRVAFAGNGFGRSRTNINIRQRIR